MPRHCGAFLVKIVAFYIVGHVYLLQVFRNNDRPVPNDQKMMTWLVALNFLSVNPLMIAFLINFYSGESSSGFHLLKQACKISTIVIQFCGTHCIFLYFWVHLDEFALVNPISKRKFFLRVFLPKFIICSVYWSLKAADYPFSETIIAYHDVILYLKNRVRDSSEIGH